MSKLDPHAIIRDLESTKDKAFQEYLNSPSTKFVLSLIPEGPPDAMMTLLRATFDAGLGYGATTVAAGLMREIMEAQSKK